MKLKWTRNTVVAVPEQFDCPAFSGFIGHKEGSWWIVSMDRLKVEGPFNSLDDAIENAESKIKEMVAPLFAVDGEVG
jgi:hypothetical protein